MSAAVKRPASLSFDLGVRTKNPLNCNLGNSRVSGIIRAGERAKHRKIARDATRWHMMRARLSPADLVPCTVHLARMSSGTMDDDGLAASQKGVRDGIAEALGVDDGSVAIRFVYSQLKVKRGVHGVRVRIERRSS